MQLVPVYSVQRSGLGKDPSLDSRLQQLRKESKSLADLLAKAQERIKDMNSDLSLRNADLLAKILSVELELAQLREQSQGVKSDDSFDEEIEAFYEQLHDSQPDTPSKASAKKVSALFRKIAAHTHPDRTNDASRHELFLAAKSCKDRKDLAGLQRIWDVVSGMECDLLSALLAAVRREAARVEQLRAEYGTVLNSFDFQLLSVYEQQPEAVHEKFRFQLQQKLEFGQMRLRLLKSRKP